MNKVSRILLYLSKTDLRLIAVCSDYAYKSQVGYGGFVLIIGIFAFFSSSYALRILSDNPAIFVISFFYALLIMLIDREIISSGNKTKEMIAGRLLLAIFVGLVISVPIELKLFEKQITQELVRIENQDNSTFRQQKEEREKETLRRLEDAKKLLRSTENELLDLGKRQGNELLPKDSQIRGVKPGTGRPGKGPVFRQLDGQIKVTENLIKQYRSDYEDLKNGLNKELTQIKEAYTMVAIPSADDLLARYVALGSVKRHPSRGWDATIMAWGVRLLLIVLEITPALIKLMQEESDYDALLQANRRRSITRIYSIANNHMDQLVESGGHNPTPTLIEQLRNDPL